METFKEQMQRDMVLRNLSPKTQYLYHLAARGLEEHFHKPPDQLNENDVKSFLHAIVTDRKLSQSTLKISYSALRFLYETTLGKGWVIDKIPYPKTVKALPHVLDKNDVWKIIEATVNLRQKAMLMVTYSAGLRASETARLRITDIDSTRMMIRVEQGKGNKDRYTLLSQTALETLREYWKQYQPKIWLFPADTKARRARAGRHSSDGLRTGETSGQFEKAGNLPYASSQLRHPSSGGRRRSAYHSSPLRPLLDQDHYRLSSRKQEEPCQGREPFGSGAAEKIAEKTEAPAP